MKIYKDGKVGAPCGSMGCPTCRPDTEARVPNRDKEKSKDEQVAEELAARAQDSDES